MVMLFFEIGVRWS